VHELSSSFILAYHGCDRSVVERLLNNKTFRLSENDYDWLGSGVYFCEANPARALAWARHLKKVGKSGPARIRQPDAIGAVINLGYCLDLISTNGTEFVKEAYLDFKHYMEQSGSPMPTNRGGDDLLQRYLDCAVINHIHSVIKRDKGKAFDTVRGPAACAARAHPAVMLAAWMALERRSFSLVDPLDFIVTVNKGIEPLDCWIFLPRTVTWFLPV
jgi:hypothetical protein